jgi:hypothetical protein
MQKKTALLASALMLVSTPLLATMPLVTEDAGTQGKGHSQIELGVETDRHMDTNSTVSTTLSYGFSNNIDLIACMPWQWQKSGSNDENGAGDVALQIKWRFYDNSDTGFSLALKPCVTLPNGDENKGFGTGKVSGGATLVATHKAKLATMHFNLGYNHNEYRLDAVSTASRTNIWRASMAAELNATDKLRAVGDIGIQTNQDKSVSTHPAFILCGLIYGVSDNADLDIGIKDSLNDAETGTTLLAGVTMRF